MNRSEIAKSIMICEMKQNLLHDLKYSMRSAEDALDRAMQVPKEEADMELIDDLNIKIEVITELAKHISKF